MKKVITILTLVACTVLSLGARKLSPSAEALLQKQEGRTVRMLKSYKDTATVVTETVKVFIDLNNPDALDKVRALGGKVFVEYGSQATAEVPVTALREISEIDDVQYVELGSPVHLCMDTARMRTLADFVHSNRGNVFPKAYTGKNVVVGVIDSGLEYDHVAFRDAGGKDTRIRRIWNQHGYGVSPSRFGYGVEYTTQSEMKSAGTDTHTQYHGSHTTNIAAGGDRSSGFYGMAPDADIVYVSFGENTVDIPNAVEYIKDYAKSVGKPCVINMSLGSHKGPHDGSSALDRYFESAAEPGCILVGACGNEGESKMHVGKEFTANSKVLKTVLSVPSGSSKNTALEIWGTPGSDFTLQMVSLDRKGNVIESSPEVSARNGKTTIKAFDNSVDCYFNIYPGVDPDSNAPNMYIECYITTVGDTRNLGVIINGTEGCKVNMWNLSMFDFVSGGLRGWTAGDNACTAGEIGGTSPYVVTVGSYNSRFTVPQPFADPPGLYLVDGYTPADLPSGEVSSFSSHGPTAAGRMKPDVLAPGALVMSAMNNFYMTNPSSVQFMAGSTTDSSGKSYYYYLNLGTSMAAPVVTGGVALWLEAFPDLTIDDILDAIQHSSQKDAFTGSEPNNTAGYGKFDVFAGLKYIFQNKSGANINSVLADDTAEDAWFESGSRTICVASQKDNDVEIYSMMGTQMERTRVSGGVINIDCSSWTPGIYVLRFANSGKAVKVAIN